MGLDLTVAQGSLLAAGPDLLDPNFARAVVLMCQHAPQGAYGLVINRPSEYKASDVLSGHDLLKSSDLRVFIGGPVYGSYVTFSYIAHFVEVRIEPGTRRVRVPRVVSVADCGRVMSPRTAASQVRGGVVWGIGASLREVSEVDPRYGGFLNADLADAMVTLSCGFVTT